MTNFENTFVRGPSPSFSDDLSENGLSTFPIGQVGSNSNFLPASTSNAIIYNEKQLKRRNTFSFWVIITLLFLLTMGNLMLTVTIIGVLRLGKGMQGMEVIPEQDSIKFFGNTDLDRVYNKCGGKIEGFADNPISVTGDNGAVNIKIHRNGQLQSKMALDVNGIAFKGINTFELKDPTSGETVFSTHRPHYTIPKGANNLHAKVVTSSRISSSIGNPLEIDSENKVTIRGSEGINIEAQGLLFISEDRILVNSSQGATFMDSSNGIFLDMEKIPIVNSEFGLRQSSVQYKICVCMPKGKLFRMPVPRMHSGKITCAHFNPIYDPCN